MRVEEIYKIPGLYSSPDMFSPPSERRPHVIRFELTKGCQWGRCTYCCGFDRVAFGEKTLDEYETHVSRVFHALSWDARDIRRVFIGGGDALGVETGKLIEAVSYTRNRFLSNHAANYREPRRISIYGSTRSINKKTIRELMEIRQAGVQLVYWGVESGSDEVLKYVNKGTTKAEILSAAEKLDTAGIDASVMIMPGLGGIKFYQQHITDTADVLSAIKPKFTTYMGINPNTKSAYARGMVKEQAAGTNRPLTDPELIWQMAEIIRQTRRYKYNSRIGCFSADIDGVGHNPLPFGTASMPKGVLWTIEPSDQEHLAKRIFREYKRVAAQKIHLARIKPTVFAARKFVELAEELARSDRKYVAFDRRSTTQNRVLGIQTPSHGAGISLEQGEEDHTFTISATLELLPYAQKLHDELENLYLADVTIKAA